jgi:hypothetical protein
MPRCELLTEPERLAFTEPATEEPEMVRHYTLSIEDLALTARRTSIRPAIMPWRPKKRWIPMSLGRCGPAPVSCR